jgi:replicative DNA helicase Mcm
VASSKALWTYLKAEAGQGFANKKVPQWIKDASPRIIARFVDAAIAGDGHVTPAGTRRYITSSTHLVDDMQELFLKLGRTSSALNRGLCKAGVIRGRAITATCDNYILTEKTDGRTQFSLRDSEGRFKFKRVPYNGMVYCVTVPNGTLVVRRNGKVLIAGNCGEYAADYDPMWLDPPRIKAPESAVEKHLRKKKERDARRNLSEGGVSFGPPALET